MNKKLNENLLLKKPKLKMKVDFFPPKLHSPSIQHLKVKGNTKMAQI